MLAMAASCGVAGGRNGTPLYGARRHWHLLAARGLVSAVGQTGVCRACVGATASNAR